MSSNNSEDEIEDHEFTISNDEGIENMNLDRGIEASEGVHEDVLLNESMQVDENLINMFLEFTGSNDREAARNYIESTNGDIEQAAELFLTGMPPLVVQSSVSDNQSGHHFSNELEMLLRHAGGGEAGLNRLQELTTRFLRMSRPADMNATGANRNNIFPNDSSLYLKFDSPERIKKEIDKLTKSKNWNRLYELGNFAIYSEKTCELILENKVVENILMETFEKSDTKEAEKIIVRSLQVFEALSTAVIDSIYEARERCSRWFISPRRNSNGNNATMTFLNGLITISSPENPSSSKAFLTQQFIDNVLPGFDVDKLEHMWLSNNFDPHWRDKKTESELLSFCLHRGCSIQFLLRLVDNIRGCRACVNPELDRVGSLDKPIILAARADFVTEDTDISCEEYPENDNKVYTLEEKREAWSYRACEILLDYGATVSTVLKNHKGITEAAKKLFEQELANTRISTRKQYLRKNNKNISKTFSIAFSTEILPKYFERALYTLRHGSHSAKVKRRILDVLTKIIAMINKNGKDDVFKAILYNKFILKELVLFLIEVYDDGSLEEFKILGMQLVMSFLVPDRLILPSYRINLEEPILEETKICEYQKHFATKLFRFGVFARLKTEKIVFETKAEAIIDFYALSIKENEKLVDIVTKLKNNQKEGLEDLSRVLIEDPYEYSDRGYKGITVFEFQETNICDILSNYLRDATEEQTKCFFQYFPPPLREIVVDESKVAENNEVPIVEHNQEIQLNSPSSQIEGMVDSIETFQTSPKPSISLHESEDLKENALYNLMLLIQRNLGSGFLVSHTEKHEPSSVKTLINIIKLELINITSAKESVSVNVLPITLMSDIENQIIRSWNPINIQYLEFCYKLVGHRIKLRSKFDNYSDYDVAHVLLYKPELNAHVVNIFSSDHTCEKTVLNMLLFDIEIVGKLVDKSPSMNDFVNEETVAIKDFDTYPKYNPGDSVYAWFSGRASFRELCQDSDSNFSADESYINKVSKFYKPGWYSAEVTEVKNSDNGFVYTLEYLETDFNKDSLIRVKNDVKIKSEIVSEDKVSDQYAKVLFIERGYLITDGLQEKVLKISDVEKKHHAIQSHGPPIYESSVSENLMFTEQEVYQTMGLSVFSVYLELKPKVDDNATSPSNFKLNQRIKARWGSRTKYYSGFISRVNLDGTYDISYDDGDTERQVIPELITDFETRKPPTFGHIFSFNKLFASNVRKKLFDILREKDEVLTIQSKYTFLTRGFKDENDFEACFATTLADIGSGVFAKYQTYEQATILAKKLRQLSSLDLGNYFEINPYVAYEPDVYINPVCKEAIDNLFIKQWKAKITEKNGNLRRKLFQKCQHEPNLEFVKPRERILVLVEVECGETGVENVWLPATVLSKTSTSVTAELDNGTILESLSAHQVRTTLDIRKKISFKSTERSKILSPTKQVASPVGRRRKQRFSEKDWGQVSQSLIPPNNINFGPVTSNITSGSNVEVVFNEMEMEDPLAGDILTPIASNELKPIALTRTFTAFGDSLSYKHISNKADDNGELTHSLDFDINKCVEKSDLQVPIVMVKYWVEIDNEYIYYNAREFSAMSVFQFISLMKEKHIRFSIEISNDPHDVKAFPSSSGVETLAYITEELFILEWLKEKLDSLSNGNKSFSQAFDASLPWKNYVLNDLADIALSDAMSVVTLDFPAWPKLIATQYSFILDEKVRENLIRCFELGTSRAVAFLQDNTPGYLSMKKKLVQTTLELSSLFSGANPDILKYEQLQTKCEKLDSDIKQIENEHFIGKLNEDLVKVSRESLLHDAFVVLKQHKQSRSRMIVQFIGENSSGDGVTIDFYTSIAVELQKRASNREVPLFIDLNTNAEANDIEFQSEGLFIQPLAPCGGNAEYAEGKKRNTRILERYYFLGLLFGKAFLDGHRVPLPLSTDFFQALILFHLDPDSSIFSESVIGKIEGSENETQRTGVISTIIALLDDKNMEELKTLLSELSLVFVDISQPRFQDEDKQHVKAIESKEDDDTKIQLPEIKILSTAQNHLDDFAAKASSQGCSQQDIEQKLLDFGATKVQAWKALGGSQHIRNKIAMAKSVQNVANHVVVGEFIKDGLETTVTIDNVCEFVDLVKKWWLLDGVKQQIQSFSDGICEIIGKKALHKLLETFSPVELKHLFCGTEEITWDEQDPLLGILVPSGGYSAKSKPILQLVSILKQMSPKERSLFLNFATAQPRVPTSGLPKIKVYPPLMERTMGIQLGFAVSALVSDAELRALETDVKPLVSSLFHEGDIINVKTTGSPTTAIVQNWNPIEKKIMFKGQPKGWFQTGQLLRMKPDFAAILKKHKAEIAIKKVLELPAVVQCHPYLRPKATTCAKTIYLPNGYRDEEHILTIFREAFEDARLGGIHD